MELWNLWKHGPERDPSGVLETSLVAATDSIEALMRCGADLALRSGVEAGIADWRADDGAARRFRLGAEPDGVWFSITHEREVFGGLPARTPAGPARYGREQPDYLDEPQHSMR